MQSKCCHRMGSLGSHRDLLYGVKQHSLGYILPCNSLPRNVVVLSFLSTILQVCSVFGILGELGGCKKGIPTISLLQSLVQFNPMPD